MMNMLMPKGMYEVYAMHMNRHLIMFYVLGILFQFICMFMFMGLFFPEDFDGLVASSSLVRGLGTLQKGLYFPKIHPFYQIQRLQAPFVIYTPYA